MMDLNDHGVLLVEDDSNDILLIQRAFRQANLTNPMRIVEDGDQAVEYLSGQGDYSDRDKYPLPAIILLDLKLPRRSGLEVLEWIRQQPIVKRIPVVVLTCSRESADIDLAYDLGVNSYLVKPVRFQSLMGMVETIDTYWMRLNQYPSIVPV